MVSVRGKPALEYIVDNFNKYGVTEIMVNVSYKPTQIMRHFGTRLVYLYEPEPLGELRTLRNAWNWLKKDVILAANGDTLTNVNIYDMYWEHCRERAAMTAFMDGDVCAGTWLFSPAYPINSHSGARTLADLKGKPFYSNAYWFDIGTPERLENTRRFYAKKARRLSHLS